MASVRSVHLDDGASLRVEEVLKVKEERSLTLEQVASLGLRASRHRPLFLLSSRISLVHILPLSFDQFEANGFASELNTLQNRGKVANLQVWLVLDKVRCEMGWDGT